MKNMHSKFISIASLLIIVLFIVGCNSDNDKDVSKDSSAEDNGESEEATPPSDVKQELIFGTDSEPVGLSPIGTWDTASGHVNNQLYEPLFELDPETDEIEPLLAESYETPDDLTWVIKLKEGIKFHDGTPFNAEAVKYSLETQADPETGSPAGHLLDFMESVEVIDEYTVELTTKEPNPTTLPVLANRGVSIVSPEANKNQNLMVEPVGTGPFKLDSWTQGDRVIMVKNEDYWGEPVHLDKVTYITVPDISTSVSMIEAKELDFIKMDEPALIPRVKAMDGVEVLQKKGTPNYFVSFNMTKEPMNEVNFRKAVSMAIDNDSFVESLDGTGFSSNGMFGPSVSGYEESIENHGYDYDPEAAKKIVEEHDYDDYELTLYASESDGYKRQAEVVQAELKEIGLNAKIVMMEWGTLLESTTNGDHDMFVLRDTNDVPGLETLYGHFHTDSIGGNNRAQHSDEAFDKIVDKARRTMNDEKRQELINEAHEMLVDEVYMSSMYHGVNTFVFDSSVKDINVTPTGEFLLKNAYRE